jgi:WD40 repeat protein
MLEIGATDELPPGFKLRCSISGHKNGINQVTWSPNGQMLASSADDYTGIWDTETGELCRKLKEPHVDSTTWSSDGSFLATGGFLCIRLWKANTGKGYGRLFSSPPVRTFCVAWSPKGGILASGSQSESENLQLWDVNTGELLRTLRGHSDNVRSVAWSPDGRLLASGSDDDTVQLWDVYTGRLLQKFKGHSSYVLNVVWSPDGRLLASGSSDRTIRLWDTRTGRETGILEGHTDAVTSLSFSFDSHLLASKSLDGTVQLWQPDTLERVAIISEPSSTDLYRAGLAFHPKAPVLATLGEKDRIIRIWDVDFSAILNSAQVAHSVHYTNAKVVLVGENSVGKSAIGLVLTGQQYVSTDSTHGRNVWTFDSQEVDLENGRRETRETLLWDLAGQPGYRVIHQLSLNDVAVALVVFDARSETDPFAGVHYWNRALRLALHVQGNSAVPMKKFLVVARIDRGGIPVSRTRIDALVQELGFDGYFETSAKEGRGVAELIEAIKKIINWEVFPKVSSTELFQDIKDFLVAEKEDERLLSTIEDLYRMFMKTSKYSMGTNELYAEFETCIGRVESRGLIRRLSFGNFVLLQPELLDAYAASLVNAVKDEPDGLGSIAEIKIQKGDFSIPKDGRLPHKEQEKLLLIAMVEDLLRHEIALREQGSDGAYLIFPSQSTRENPDLPDPEGKSVIFGFEGPVLNIYATLAVRLSHSGVFKKKELWKNAVTYTTGIGGLCGIYLHNIGEGRGELTLFFDEIVTQEMRFHFEEYVKLHLERWALPESIQRKRIFGCQVCGFIVTDQLVKLRLQRDYNWADCPVCSTRIFLLDSEGRFSIVNQPLISEMDRAADTQRQLEAFASVLKGKIATSDFDVFLCHHSVDKPEVKKIGEQLKEQGILPWLDEWESRPGLPWQRLLGQQIDNIKSAAIFVGNSGIGPWQQLELEAFLHEFVNRGCPLIPVLLPEATREPQLPIFLKGMTWVDFRQPESNPMGRLIWGITGKRDRSL